MHKTPMAQEIEDMGRALSTCTGSCVDYRDADKIKHIALRLFALAEQAEVLFTALEVPTPESRG